MQSLPHVQHRKQVRTAVLLLGIFAHTAEAYMGRHKTGMMYASSQGSTVVRGAAVSNTHAAGSATQPPMSCRTVV
jgi:hypothetical protein